MKIWFESLIIGFLILFVFMAVLGLFTGGTEAATHTNCLPSQKVYCLQGMKIVKLTKGDANGRRK